MKDSVRCFRGLAILVLEPEVDCDGLTNCRTNLMSRIFGSARCDCAIFFPFSLGQLAAVASLEKNRAVAHGFVNDDLPVESCRLGTG